MNATEINALVRSVLNKLPDDLAAAFEGHAKTMAREIGQRCINRCLTKLSQLNPPDIDPPF